MEELGGNKNFVDRFVAQHAAFFYYWIVVFIYIVNPTLAYNLNEVSGIFEVLVKYLPFTMIDVMLIFS